jgi:hypothetical protein
VRTRDEERVRALDLVPLARGQHRRAEGRVRCEARDGLRLGRALAGAMIWHRWMYFGQIQ